MQAAPPVSVRCGDGGAWRFFAAALLACSSAVFVYWLMAHAGWAAEPAIAAWGPPFGAGLVGVALGTIGWRRSREGSVQLSWDGRRWTLDETGGAPEIAIDLDHWLLVRFRSSQASGARWLPLSAGRAGTAWHGLRTALSARPPRDTLRDSGAPDRVADR